MTTLLFKNATIVNENNIELTDVLVSNGRIAKISKDINAPADARIIDATGKHLLPGMIDDQVHFREPGFPTKGTIASESKSAVAGGITTYMEMPNVNPQTTTLEALEEKYERAAKSSFANYAFYLARPTTILTKSVVWILTRHVASKCLWGHPPVICWLTILRLWQPFLLTARC